MDGGFVGAGTVVNIAAIIIGAVVGMLLGNRLPDRVHVVLTDALGLVTVLVAGLSAYEVTAPEFVAAVGAGVPVLVVLGSLLIGGIVGSLLRLEDRLQALAGGVEQAATRLSPRSRGLTATPTPERSARFIQGWLTASLLFCVGPLAILGSLSDGLGRGIDQLVLKSALDLVAALAFAASFGIGVVFSVFSVTLVQGFLTVLGWALGAVISPAQVSALTAVGGLLLAGLALRLLRIRDVPVADLLPALLVAPLLVLIIGAAR